MLNEPFYITVMLLDGKWGVAHYQGRSNLPSGQYQSDAPGIYCIFEQHDDFDRAARRARFLEAAART